MVLFERISGLAMVVGVLTCIGSFGAFVIPGGGFYNLIIWIISLLFGISLIMMGGTRVIKEDEFYKYMTDMANKIKKSQEF